MTQVFSLGSCRIVVDEDLVSTRFASGVCCLAEPQDTASYKMSAWRNGYQGDVLEMNQCHDLTHTLVNLWLGRQESAVLLAVATCQPPPPWADLEEEAVQAIERLANALRVDLGQVALELSK